LEHVLQLLVLHLRSTVESGSLKARSTCWKKNLAKAAAPWGAAGWAAAGTVASAVGLGVAVAEGVGEAAGVALAEGVGRARGGAWAAEEEQPDSARPATRPSTTPARIARM